MDVSSSFLLVVMASTLVAPNSDGLHLLASFETEDLKNFMCFFLFGEVAKTDLHGGQTTS